MTATPPVTTQMALSTALVTMGSMVMEGVAVSCVINCVNICTMWLVHIWLCL